RIGRCSDRVRGARRRRAARPGPWSRLRPRRVGPLPRLARRALPRRALRQPRRRRERCARRAVLRLADERGRRSRARRRRHRAHARVRRQSRRLHRTGVRAHVSGARRQARPLLDGARRPEGAPDAAEHRRRVRALPDDGAGSRLAHVRRELARRARRARAARARRGDLRVPPRACADGRRVAGPGVRRRDVRLVRPHRRDRHADARDPRRRGHRRRPAERRPARRAAPERARRARAGPRAPARLGGLGACRRARDGVPRSMSGTHTIARWLHDRARNTPNRVAIDYDGRLVTYAELAAGAEAYAAAFVEAGLRRGDRVATLTGSTPEHVEVLFACAQLGLMLLPLSWRLTAPELRYQLDDAEPSLFLVEDEYRELAEQTGHRFMPLAEPEQRGLAPEGPGPDDDDGLLLIYTSGTTGKPKGAVLTHANCFWTNLSFDGATGVRGDDVVLQVLPQFHVGGWNVQSLLAWLKGATVVLERQFDAARALRLIEEKRVTTMMGVPATYLFMADEPGFADADLWSLDRAVVGGAPMPEALLHTWAERGCAIV